MIDWTKPIQTTHKPPRPARVLCTDLRVTSGPIVVAVDHCGTEDTWRVCVDGRLPDITSFKLVNVPQKHVRYVNMYNDDGSGSAWMTKQAADQGAASIRIACVRVEFTEGQFDE